MVSQNSDLQIIQNFLNGDKTAYREICRLIDRCLLTWKNTFGNRIDDLRADTLLEVYEELNRGNFQVKNSLKSFIYSMTNHNCIDLKRYEEKFSKKEISQLNLPEKALNPEEKMEMRQQGRINYRVLRLLSGECRELFRLKLKKELKNREIADLKGKTEAYIRRKFWACRDTAKKIREKILKKDKLF